MMLYYWKLGVQLSSGTSMQTHHVYYLWEKIVPSRNDFAGLCVQWEELDKYLIKVSSYRANKEQGDTVQKWKKVMLWTMELDLWRWIECKNTTGLVKRKQKLLR